MKNLVDYLKDKIYYILGVVTLLIILLVVISSCSSGSSKSYSGIENDMVSAAKEYYSDRKERLPKENGDSIKLTIGTLIDEELLEEIKDPNNSEQSCEGYVQVKKVDNDYVYIPFLTCKGNYEPEYLVDKIKNSKTDEYGNGVYESNGDYVYRGEDVKNYILFNNQLWRIMRLTSDGKTKIILDNPTEQDYIWEDSYNVEQGDNVGITDDYLLTDIRKTLVDYYKKNFSESSKANIVPTNLCIGALNENEDFNREKECSKTKDNEYVGLMNISDYQAATLDYSCNNPQQPQCTNRNYLTSSAVIVTWTLNTVAENNYMVYGFAKGKLIRSEASGELTINPVIYLSENAIVSEGKGTLKNPFVIK